MPSALPYVELIGAQLAIGAAAIFARFALAGAGPLAVSALRLAIASVPAVAFALLAARKPVGARREALFAVAGAALAAHFAAWIASLHYTSVAISTLLVTTTPLFTETYDALRLRRAPSRRVAIALALAGAGLTIIVTRRDAPAPLAGHGELGALLALGGAIAIAVYFSIVQAAGVRDDGPPVPTGAIVARTYSWAALVLGIAALVMRQPPPAAGDHGAWFGILGMALISQLLGHTGLNAALKHFTPTIVSTTTLLEPVIAALLASVVFRETLPPAVIAGGALVLVAVGLALTSTARPALETA
jgi:drug/metabolite transporter (DMT)-like permease